VWPLYGLNQQHTRAFLAADAPHPPFRKVWSFRGAALLEFPPVIGLGRLVQLADNGVLNAIAKNSGRVLWRRKLGALAASTPAVGGASVYVSLLRRNRFTDAGRIVAVSLTDGRVRWSRPLPSRSESSPLLHSGRLYVGSEDGTVLCLDAHSGHVRWRYRAAGAVKASPTLAHGVLFFGDYGGQVQAVRARDGKRIWVARPPGAGTFYATAAVDFGRVFIGSTSGAEYALSQAGGRVDWVKRTGSYVYSSAAVASVRGAGPTVYFGSYDGYFYALNARTGAVRWTYPAGGRISGSPTIIGRLVYFAVLGTRSTYGLSASTGRVVFRMNQGSFDPVVSDGRHLFLTGYSRLFALRPTRRGPRTA
jgi:outer membrane protein assembly factor BamB